MKRFRSPKSSCGVGPSLAEQLEPRMLLSVSGFEEAVSLDGEFNRQGVTVVRTSVAETGECDTFSFTARETGNQRLVLRDLNDSGLNGVLTIFDEDGNIVRQKDARGAGGREIGQFPAELGERFFVQVGGGEGGEIGDYRLRVRTEPGPVPDSVEDAALRIDSLFDEGNGRIALVESTIGEQDHTRGFAFTARDDGSVGFILRTSAAGFDTSLDARMIITNEAGELLRIKNKFAGGGREQARIDVALGERYFILVSGVWGDDVEGDFRLRLKAPAGDPPAVVIGGIPVEDALPLDLVSTPSGLRVNASAGLEMTAFDFSQSPLTALPDFDAFTPASTGTLDTVNFASAEGDVFGIGLTDDFGLVIEGLIELDVTGTWGFTLESDDGSRLFIDGVLVVDNDSVHEMTLAEGSIDLEAGFHDIRVEYFDASGPAGLTLGSASPGQLPAVVAADDLSNEILVHDPLVGNALYALTPAEAANLRLRVETDEQTNATLGLFDADGNLINDADRNGRAQGESLSSGVVANQPLFVLTSENTGTPNIEGRALGSISAVALDDENEGLATIGLNPGVLGAARFTGGPAGQYRVTVEEGFLGRVTIYDDSGFEITREVTTDADGGPDSIRFQLPADGGFVATFDAALGDGTPGEATLFAQGPTDTIDGISILDAIEMDHDTPFDGTIANVGDRLLFTVTADFIITTFALQTFSGFDGRMRIFDENDVLLALVDVGEANFEDFFIVRLESFRFYVVVDGGDTTGDFQFTIT